LFINSIARSIANNFTRIQINYRRTILKNRDGQTALDIAVKRRYTDIVEILNSVVPEQTETEEEPTSCQMA
jgi:ankyrin repeat protein